MKSICLCIQVHSTVQGICKWQVILLEEYFANFRHKRNPYLLLIPCPQKGGKFYPILLHKFITHRTGKIYLLFPDGLYANISATRSIRKFPTLYLLCHSLHAAFKFYQDSQSVFQLDWQCHNKRKDFTVKAFKYCIYLSSVKLLRTELILLERIRVCCN